MAEKNDHDADEKDEKDEDSEAEEAKEKASAAAEKEDEDDEADEEDDEEDDEEEEAKPAAKPVAKVTAAKPGATAKRGAAPLAKARPVAARKSGSLAKSLILFVIIVGGLAGAFIWFGNESSSGPAAPKWKTGDTADLELTLVADDKKNLACSTTDEVAGAHCAFEDKAKAWSKGDNTDDKKLLKPYTTTDHVQVLASGLWSDPGMTGTLPAVRFSVKCKYKVEGKVKTAAIRWNSDGPWYDSKDLYTGSLSACKLVQ
ncbi:MAG: hypothetical protein ABJE95_10410 [Byssovorax sp.]